MRQFVEDDFYITSFQKIEKNFFFQNALLSASFVWPSVSLDLLVNLFQQSVAADPQVPNVQNQKVKYCLSYYQKCFGLCIKHFFLDLLQNFAIVSYRNRVQQRERDWYEAKEQISFTKTLLLLQSALHHLMPG